MYRPGTSGRSAMIWEGARSGCLEHEVVWVGEVAVGGDPILGCAISASLVRCFGFSAMRSGIAVKRSTSFGSVWTSRP